MSHTRRQAVTDGMVVGALADADRRLRMRRTGGSGDRTFIVANIWPDSTLWVPPMHVSDTAVILAAIHELHAGTVDVTLMYGAGDTVVDTFSLTTTTTEDTLAGPVTVPAGDRIRIAFSSASDMADGVAFTVVFA